MVAAFLQSLCNNYHDGQTGRLGLGDRHGRRGVAAAVPAAGNIFHYSRSQAPPPALPLIDLIGDILHIGLELSAGGAATSPSVVIIGQSVSSSKLTDHDRLAVLMSLSPRSEIDTVTYCDVVSASGTDNFKPSDSGHIADTQNDERHHSVLRLRRTGRYTRAVLLHLLSRCKLGSL